MSRSFSGFALAAALLLSTGLASAQDAAPKPLAPGQATYCHLDRIRGTGFLLVGRKGFCGEGSHISFQAGRTADYLITQLCDHQRTVNRSPTSGPQPDFNVSCWFTGQVRDPEDAFTGAPLRVQAPAKAE